MVDTAHDDAYPPYIQYCIHMERSNDGNTRAPRQQASDSQPDPAAGGCEGAEHPFSCGLCGRVSRRLRRRAHSRTMEPRGAAGRAALGPDPSRQRVDCARLEARVTVVPTPCPGLGGAPERPRIRAPRSGRTPRRQWRVAIPKRTSRSTVRDVRAAQQPGRAPRMGRHHTHAPACGPLAPDARRSAHSTRPTCTRLRAVVASALVLATWSSRCGTATEVPNCMRTLG